MEGAGVDPVPRCYQGGLASLVSTTGPRKLRRRTRKAGLVAEQSVKFPGESAPFASEASTEHWICPHPERNGGFDRERQPNGPAPGRPMQSFETLASQHTDATASPGGW